MRGATTISVELCFKYAWGIHMKKFGRIVIAAAAGLLISVSGAEAACKKAFYTGSDRDPIWWEGRDNSRANWSDKVAGHIGKKWSKWSKARDANDTCTWLPTQGVNWCVARARPCK